MNVLSIQSAVSYGHVGNSAAVFALQRLGHEAWPINTVAFSNHPEHGTWRGRVAEADEIRALVEGLDALGALARCDAVLTGYLGDAALGEVVLDAVARVRRANPRALFWCDPVMGHVGRGFFVRPGIPEFFRGRALARADVLFPNRLELAYLSGSPADSVAEAVAAADRLRRGGPGLVVVKGVRPSGGRIGALAVGRAGVWSCSAPVVDAPANGAGDLFAALFLGHLLHRRSPAAALARAVSSVHAVLAATAAAAADELQIVAAQDAIARPKVLFKARRLR